MNLINVYPNFDNFGGAQNVALKLHQELNFGSHKFLSGFTNFTNIHSKYEIDENEYIQINHLNYCRFNESIIISHHRKLTTLFIMMKKIFRYRFHLIHVAHNEFYDKRLFSFFPENIIAVSERVKENHINYFNLSSVNIEVIHNGIQDVDDKYMLNHDISFDEINILYPATICKVKRQLEIVENLKGKIPNNIKILFAGNGKDYTKLCALCKQKENFEALGFIDIDQIMPDINYVMLFSQKEGLPISLIEATKYGKPIICNDVGGNLEVLNEGKNGFCANNIEELRHIINNLNCIDEDEYLNMAKYSRKIFENDFELKKMIKGYQDFIVKKVGNKR